MAQEDYASPAVDVSVVLPAYNEHAAITSVIEDVRASLETTDYVYEIVVVDDNSSDDTPDQAAALGVRVVRRRHNGGSGASRKTGVKVARGEWVVMLDADGSYHPADIPSLLEHLPRFDQVNGARKREEGTMKLLRVPMKWFIRQLASYLSGYRIPDLNTGMKAFKRDLMRRYLWVVSDGFSCVTSMTLAFLCNGHSVKYVPTDYHPRIGASKFHPVKDTLAYLNTVFRLVIYFQPRRVFFPLGFIFAIIGVIRAWINWTAVGHMGTADVAILLFAAVVFMVGVMADVILTVSKGIVDRIEAAGARGAQEPDWDEDPLPASGRNAE